MKFRLEACKSPIIAEIDLDNIFSDIMNKIFKNKESIINDMISYYSNLKNIKTAIKKQLNFKTNIQLFVEAFVDEIIV